MYRFWRPQPAQAMTRATKRQVAKYVKRLRRSESVHKTRFGTIRPNRAAPLVSQPVRQGNCTTRFPACQPSKLRHPFSACRQDELYRSSSSLPAWRTIPFVFRPVSKEGCTIRFPCGQDELHRSYSVLPARHSSAPFWQKFPELRAAAVHPKSTTWDYAAPALRIKRKGTFLARNSGNFCHCDDICVHPSFGVRGHLP